MSTGQAVLFTVVLFALLGACALIRTAVRRFRIARSMFDIEATVVRHPAGKKLQAGDER